MKKFISLLSGGLDSPVASYLMIKKNFKPVFLSFLTSDDFEHTMKNKVVLIVQKLKKFVNDNVKLYLINHDLNLEVFKKNCDRKLTCVLCKRMMIRIAKKIGQKENINILITGDILGEQASQTLDNLYAYNDLIKDIVILRPLIGCNKLEVISMNKKIGLYEICSQNSAFCQYYPQFPETHAKSLEVINAESNVKLEVLINESIKNAEILEF